jgi:heavy metal sensor kinase
MPMMATPSELLRGHSLTIRTRLTLWYLFSAGAVLVAFGLFQYYWLQSSLIASVDNGLEIASSQALGNIDNENGTPAFQNTDTIAPLSGHLGKDDFTVRLVSANGSFLDGIGAVNLAPAASSLRVGFATIETHSTRWRVYSQPVVSPDGTQVAFLQTAQSLAQVDEALLGLRTQLLLGLPLILLLLAVGGAFLSNRALEPVDRIIRTAQGLSASDLSQRIDYQGPEDEIGKLAKTLDSMLERLQASFERERRFTADSAHELRTPLTALKGQIEIALNQEREPSYYHRTLTYLAAQVERLIRMSDGLLFLSRSDHDQAIMHASTIDVSELLEVVAEQFDPLAQGKTLRLVTNFEPHLMVNGDRDLLIRLVLNVLDNAIKHSPEGGEVTLSVCREDKAAVISVSDRGAGIAPQHLPYLFDRFYRVESDRSSRTGGSGLGLAIAAEIAHLHGGDISVQSTPDEGATFIVNLPLAIS